MTISIFEVIGPVMVGPSSSHTAGAARLGNIARRVCGRKISQVDFYLHGSFAETYRGHGTDKALLGGILGMSTSDEEIRDSFKRAEEEGLTYNIYTTDLGNVHPNTVRIVMHTDSANSCEIIGSSIGGGKVMVSSINKMAVEFSGQYPTVIINHRDKPGVVAHVTSILSKHGINIAFLKLFRQAKGSQASMVIESDDRPGQEVLAQLKSVNEIENIIFVDTDE